MIMGTMICPICGQEKDDFYFEESCFDEGEIIHCDDCNLKYNEKEIYEVMKRQQEIEKEHDNYIKSQSPLKKPKLF
jgi:ribosome-binding protein aMBF1 (putative translation factor)